MKTAAFSPRKIHSWLGSFIITLAVISWAPSAALAEPWAELQALSALPKLDRARVEKGEVVSGRATGMNFARGQSVESVFLVDAPLSKTLGTLRAWNGTRHSDLKVYLHHDLGGSSSPAAFSKLGSAPSNGAVKALANAKGDDLQLTKAEAEKLPGGGSTLPVEFWGSALDSRVKAYQGGGLSALPAYETRGAKVSPAAEASALLKGAPKLASHFRGLLGRAGVSGSPSKPALYWELVNAEGKGVINLGAAVSGEAGGGAQAADVTYYASGNYYVLLVVHQLWPITVNGQEKTLVWRGDLISSAALGELQGIEKNAAGAALAKEVARMAGYFQKDAAK